MFIMCNCDYHIIEIFKIVDFHIVSLLLPERDPTKVLENGKIQFPYMQFIRAKNRRKSGVPCFELKIIIRAYDSHIDIPTKRKKFKKNFVYQSKLYS